jgi:zinc/manganese transport system permease protein
VVVAISIKAVGVLLISAFVMIPPCASRLLSRNFTAYVLMAAALGAGCAVLGLLLSGALDLPSGPSVVVLQLLGFLLALFLAPRQGPAQGPAQGSGGDTGTPKRVGWS